MSLVFTRFVNMSLCGGILILAVIIIRLLFNNISKRIFIIAWFLVMIRLICPFTVINPLSPIPQKFGYSGISDFNRVLFSVNLDHNYENVVQIVREPVKFGSYELSSALTFRYLVDIVWIAGTVVILLRAWIKTARLRKIVGNSFSCGENVYLCSGINTPFVLGIIKPTIFCPLQIDDVEKRYIIDHEKEHIKHHDPLLKFVFFIILSVHWFNPVCHIAYRLFSEDLEMACDEETVDGKDAGYKAGYVQALLNCELSSPVRSFESVSFNGQKVKRRVKRMVETKKEKKVSVAVFGIVCAVLVFFLMTNCVSAEENARDAKGTAQINSDTISAMSDSSEELKNSADLPPSDKEAPNSMNVVIRDKNENIVETVEHGTDDQLLPSKDSGNLRPVSEKANSGPGYDALAGIREVVLKEGVYRNCEQYGAPVISVCDGTVVKAEYEHAYGFCVTIMDDSGLTWKYGHCSELTVKAGDTVLVGDIVAYVGTSGLTAEPCVIIKISGQ